MTDAPRLRGRVVHGWAFTASLSADDRAAIKKYLETGDPTFLPAGYATVRDALAANFLKKVGATH